MRSTSSGAAGAPPYARALHRREVVLVEVRRLEDAPHDRRHAADRRDLLALDESASRRRDRTARPASARPWRRSRTLSVIVDRQPVTWNSGTTSSDADCTSASRLGRRRARASPAATPEHDDVLQVRDHLAVRDASRPSAGRSCPTCRGSRGGRPRRSATPASRDRRRRRPAPRTAAPVASAALVDHEDVLAATGSPASRSRDDADAAGVADQHLRLGVVEAELELLGLPPRVQRHERRAEDRARPERDHPLGHVRRARARRGRRADAERRPATRRARARARSCSPNVRRLGRPARASRRRRAPRSAPSARAATACAACRPASDGRATSSTTISNGPPGPVSCARRDQSSRSDRPRVDASSSLHHVERPAARCRCRRALPCACCA